MKVDVKYRLHIIVFGLQEITPMVTHAIVVQVVQVPLNSLIGINARN